MSRKRNQNSPVEQRAKRNRKNTNESVKTPRCQEDNDEHDYYDYFEPKDCELFSEAHKMVEKLVFKDGPYRCKLLQLADRAIKQHNEKNNMKYENLNTTLVEVAWKDVQYAWCSESHGVITKGMACAFTWKTDIGGNGNVPLIAFCRKFKAAKTKQEQEGFIAKNPGQMWSLLFFFRKIKHEFLHAAQRYLAIKYEKRFDAKVTPDHMIPWKGDGSPEAGDYDEEEDSGGQILPFTPMQKFSNNNPLCLYYMGRESKFIKLTIKQVEALLNPELYMFSIESIQHGCDWRPRDSRACKFEKVKSHFGREFFDDSVCFSIRKNRKRKAAKPKKADKRLSSSGIEIKSSKDNNDLRIPSSHMWRYFGARITVYRPDASKSFGYSKKIDSKDRSTGL